MNDLLLFAAAEPGMVESTAKTFGVNWPLFISQLVSFCIVAFLLQRFAFKPIINVLEERRERIREANANAEQIKKELANAQVKAQEIIGQANTQANKLIEEARSAAAKVQEQETQKAIHTAEQIIAKAREAAEGDHKRMLADLRREVGRLAVEAAAKVTGKILTAEDQRRLADESNKQLASLQ